MSDDIVERLRSSGPSGWNAEAADEIERLREYVRIAEDRRLHIERLREALLGIRQLAAIALY